MKITHHMPNPGPTRRGFRVLLIGCGGNGSAVLFGLPYLHHALIAWGFTDGLQVSVMDADTVSPTRCVRQPFGSADIGQNKAAVLINRVNLFHGLSWRSDETFFTKDAPNNTGSSYDNTVDFVVSCVDTRTVLVFSTPVNYVLTMSLHNGLYLEKRTEQWQLNRW